LVILRKINCVAAGMEKVRAFEALSSLDTLSLFPYQTLPTAAYTYIHNPYESKDQRPF
jgi:hypothetical protein